MFTVCTDMIEAFKQGKWVLFPDEVSLKILQVTLKENVQQPAATRRSLAIPSACRFIYHTRHEMFIPLSNALPVLNCRMMPTITTSFLRQTPGLLHSIPLHVWEDTGESGSAEDPVLCRLVAEN